MPASRESTRAELFTNVPSSSLENVILFTLTSRAITIIIITHNAFVKMFAGTNFGRTGQAIDDKSGQWLGSLVASSGEDGTVMVGTTTMFGWNSIG